jgi:hypothetical protein
MADFLITAVSASYTGTDQDDLFRNGAGNLRDITVVGLSGNDLLSLGSAVGSGTGAGGRGLGYSLRSSDINLGAGDDTYVFSGQVGSGSAVANSTLVQMGTGNDIVFINRLAEASATTVRGGSGNDEISFVSNTAGNTAFNVLINGNAGNDLITSTWDGSAQNFLVEGGQGNDTISADFSAVGVYTAAATGSNTSGARVQGNKGADLIGVQTFATSTNVVINGNTGNDTIVYTAFNDIANSTVFGGRDNDEISASLDGGLAPDVISATNFAIQGGLGNDSASLTFSAAAYLSDVTLEGNSGNDALIINNASRLVTAVGASVLGGSGSDTITVNVSAAGAVLATGASAFVVDLGTEATAGGIINVNVSGTIQGTGALLRGSSAADTISLRAADLGDISAAVVSGNAGNDVISLLTTTAAGSTLVGLNVIAGSGDDTITATLNANGGYYVTAGGNLLNGNTGNDVVAINVNAGAGVTGVSVEGGLGTDAITLSLASGGSAVSIGNTAGRNFSIAGNSGADTISLIGAQGSDFDVEVLGGSGADIITGTLSASTFAAGGTTADGGLGNDTISFTQTNSAGTFTNGTFIGGSGVDSITLSFAGTGTNNGDFGTIIGNTGADIAQVGIVRSGGANGIEFSGIFNGGVGADSIAFTGVTGHGGAVISGSIFRYLSGDSTVQVTDSISLSVTAGGGALSGGRMTFSGYNNLAFSKTNAGSGGLTGNAYVAGFTGGGGANVVLGSTGGLITFNYGSAGTAAGNNQTAGFIISTGNATTANIISAVDRLVVTGNAIASFNIQNGSGGAINGYMFIQGGVNPDTLIRLNGLAQQGAAIPNDFVFRAGSAGNFRVNAPGANGSGGLTFGLAL